MVARKIDKKEFATKELQIMPYMPYFIDKYYLLLIVPTFLLSLLAQILVKSTFSKYSKKRLNCQKSGAEIARLVLQSAGINYVDIQAVSGSLTDHFDPRSKTLRLSDPVYGKASVAAAGVAAHEAGHAIQQNVKYWPLVLRGTLVPAANIGSKFGPYLAMFGLLFRNDLGLLLLQIGILLFGIAVLFYLITLPVEFNASRRAIKKLSEIGYITSDELKGARKVLTVAAMTYLASALTAFASLLRLILIARGRRR